MSHLFNVLLVLTHLIYILRQPTIYLFDIQALHSQLILSSLAAPFFNHSTGSYVLC